MTILNSAFLVALAAALALTPLVRRIALATGFVAVPRSNRLHKTPTPVLGGLALLTAFVLGLALTGHLDLKGLQGAGEAPPVGAVLMLVAIGAFVLGLADDVKDLTPAAKLAGQIVLTAFFLGSGGRGPFAINEFNGILGLFWLVGLMNACNFIDNMDGTLTGVSFVIAVGLGALGVSHAWGDAPGWLPALAGALIGFFVYNRPPARLFMGDAGSLLIGVALSSAAWVIASATHDLRVWLALPLLFAYPIFDISFVTFTRLARRQPVWLGGCDHTNHRLLTRIKSPVLTLALVIALQIVGVVAGLIVARTSVVVALAGLVLVGGGFTAFGFWVARIPFRTSTTTKTLVPARTPDLPSRNVPKPASRAPQRATLNGKAVPPARTRSSALRGSASPEPEPIGVHGEPAGSRSTGTDA